MSPLLRIAGAQSLQAEKSFDFMRAGRARVYELLLIGATRQALVRCKYWENHAVKILLHGGLYFFLCFQVVVQHSLPSGRYGARPNVKTQRAFIAQNITNRIKLTAGLDLDLEFAAILQDEFDNSSLPLGIPE